MIRIEEADLNKTKTLYKTEEIKVYSAKVEFNFMNVCVKKTKTEDCLVASNAFQEALSLATFSHPNVVKIYQSFLNGSGSDVESFSIVMELFELGNLSKLIKMRQKSGEKWSEATLLFYCNQLIGALAFLQEMNCAHRDIKPENILVGSSGKILKISDFGDSIKVVRSSMSLKGTANYLSPILRDAYNRNQGDQIETVHHNPFKSDVFSLGLVILYMATFKDPTIFKKVKTLKEDLDECIKSLGREYNNLKIILRALLSYDENTRPDFLELREQMLITHSYNDLNFCTKCQNYLISTNFIQIYDTLYCPTCEQETKSNTHKCSECNKKKGFSEVYIFENKVYCKECLNIKSLNTLPL